MNLKPEKRGKQMILEAKQTTVAYRCPKCGAGVMSAIGFFNLTGNMVKLKCDCGESEMTVVIGKDGKVSFTVPCILCPEPHRYTLSTKSFFSKELFTLPCQYSGISVAMMGDMNNVKAELARTELELLDMLEKSGVKDFESIRGEQSLSDPQVLEILVYVIKELDEEGRIHCLCQGDDEREYEIEFLKEAMRVSCKCCGASKEIPTASLIDAHEFLNADSLELKA